jgi:hypothetical protein
VSRSIPESSTMKSPAWRKVSSVDSSRKAKLEQRKRSIGLVAHFVDFHSQQVTMLLNRGADEAGFKTIAA